MILFFGIRPGKTHCVELTDIICPYCQNTDTLNVAITSNYFHLFWIKIFKIGTYKTVICSHCKKLYDQEDFSESMKIALERLTMEKR
ncbi:MAG: zinc-ribbon domain-containing protein [Flavobacteriales bacterium]|nr:MAG: zinc-ribbon domain-containing protein [Flavobacteriales bacterium]